MDDLNPKQKAMLEGLFKKTTPVAPSDSNVPPTPTASLSPSGVSKKDWTAPTQTDVPASNPPSNPQSNPQSNPANPVALSDKQKKMMGDLLDPNQGGIPGASIMNFLDYGPRDLEGMLYGLTMAPRAPGSIWPTKEGFEQYRAEALKATEIPETKFGKEAEKILNVPGKYVGKVEDLAGEKALGKENWEKARPFADALLDVIGARGTIKGIQDVANPKPPSAYRQAADTLRDRGVRLTLGQNWGGPLSTVEEAAQSTPIAGLAMADARKRSIVDFNQSTLNHEILDHVGERLPGDIEPGYKSIAHTGDVLDDKYGNALSQAQFRPTLQLSKDLNNIWDMVQELPPDQIHQFRKIVDNNLGKKLYLSGDPAAQMLYPESKIVGAPYLQDLGAMDGESLKHTISAIKTKARNYRKAQDPNIQDLGIALEEVVHSIDNEVALQNPHIASELKNIDIAWAKLVRVEAAAGARVASEGIFMPSDLLGSIKKSDPRIRHRGYNRGEALMQDWAAAGQKVLPSKIPNSYTAERLAAQAILGAGTYHFAPAAIPALGATYALYSYPPALSAVGEMGNMVGSVAPYAAQAALPPKHDDLQKLMSQAISGQQPTDDITSYLLMLQHDMQKQDNAPVGIAGIRG